MVMRSVEVQILGQSYSIKGDADEAYIKALAQFVDDKLKEIYRVSPSVNPLKALIMTSINIADELFKARLEQESLDKMIEEKTKVLAGLLE
ncbi:MAG TPA: cell division protein ZapA [Nitrospiraceae bacterium]|nr:cell division protein ZapA [Nitrospiraceae bacterium]